jgi:hypothetical protein
MLKSLSIHFKDIKDTIHVQNMKNKNIKHVTPSDVCDKVSNQLLLTLFRVSRHGLTEGDLIYLCTEASPDRELQ